MDSEGFSCTSTPTGVLQILLLVVFAEASLWQTDSDLKSISDADASSYSGMILKIN